MDSMSWIADFVYQGTKIYLLKQINAFTHTFDGRNPAPPGMYKTL